MSQKEHGDDGPVLIGQEQMFDPQQGWFTQLIFRGSRPVLTALRSVYIDAGWKATISDTNSQWPRLTVNSPDNEGDPALEQPVDHWDRNTDFVQEDIWQSAKVIQDLYDSLNSSGQADFDGIFASTKKLIEVEIKRGTPPSLMSGKLDFRFSNLDTVIGLYTTIQRGQLYTEVARPLLTRSRTISPRYLFPSTMDATPKLYTTFALISIFNIPETIANLLPPNPPHTPSHTVWSWKLRKNTSNIIPAHNKAKETLDWTFAAWSTVTYQLID